MTPHDLIASFGTLADAPDGIKRLRELVLQLAVRGKLVPQDAGDEPASKLLPKLARDVEDHVRQRHFRALQRPEPLPQPDERIDVPTGWEAVHLANVAGRRSGNSKLIKGQQHDAAGPELFAGFSASGQDVWLDTFEHEGEAIIVSAVGARCGKCFAANGRWSAIANTHIVWPYASVVYLPFLMLHVNDERFWSRSGGAQPFVKIEESFQSIIGLPPLAEQHRIVAKVDELMAFLDRLEAARNARDATRTALRDAALAALRDADGPDDVETAWGRIAGQMDDLFAEPADVGPLRQAVLQLAVRGRLVRQDVGDEPAKVRKVSEVASFLNGYAFKSEWYVADGVRVLRNQNVGHGIARWDDTKRVSPAIAKEFERFALQTGDITLSLDRPIITTGLKVAVVREQDLPCLLLQRVAKLEFRRDRMSPSYFYLWLNSPDFTGAIDPGRSNGVPHISTREVERLTLLVPPLAEQHRIVAKVDELMGLLDKLEARLRDAKDLQGAFAAAAVHHLDVDVAA